MVLVRVHPAIGEQSADVKLPPPASRILHRLQQYWIGKEIAIFDHQIDLGNVHVDHAACAYVQVSDFAVAHLSGGQPDMAPAGVNQGVGKFLEQAIVVRLARQ